MPRILVVGSSGILAHYIVDEIVNSYGINSLFISDYKLDCLLEIQNDITKKYGGTPETRLIDISSIDSIRQGLARIDVVIVPLSQTQPLIQRVCIEKGIDCIDLSVSEKFIDKTLVLHDEALKAGSLLLMAAGLFPGLSGIIACEVHNNNPNAILDIGLVQSQKGIAGTSGIADMLQLFNQKVVQVTPTGFNVKKGFSYTKAFDLGDSINAKNLRLANFVERKYLEKKANIKSNYWSAFDSEVFNKLISFLKVIGILSLFENPKYRLKSAHFLAKNKQNNDEAEVVYLIGQSDEQNKIVIPLESDYAATASCVVAFLKVLKSNKNKENGVYFPFELFSLEDMLSHIGHKVIK